MGFGGEVVPTVGGEPEVVVAFDGEPEVIVAFGGGLEVFDGEPAFGGGLGVVALAFGGDPGVVGSPAGPPLVGVLGLKNPIVCGSVLVDVSRWLT
jgi:hypothetical protein